MDDLKRRMIPSATDVSRVDDAARSHPAGERLSTFGPDTIRRSKSGSTDGWSAGFPPARPAGKRFTPIFSAQVGDAAGHIRRADTRVQCKILVALDLPVRSNARLIPQG